MFDGVTRKIASRIQSAYTEKMTEELLYQEDKVSQSADQKKARKLKKQRNQKSSNEKISSDQKKSSLNSLPDELQYQTSSSQGETNNEKGLRKTALESESNTSISNSISEFCHNIPDHQIQTKLFNSP